MKKERNISIDRFRGILVFLMIFFQLLEHFKSFGVFATISSHAPDSFIKNAEAIEKGFKGIFFLPNMTLADIIAPAFLFAISLTLIPSYKRRCEEHGKKYAIKSLLERYLILIGIGVMMSSINVLLDGNLSNGFIDFIDIPVLICTFGILIIGVIWCILKKKEIGKKIGKVIKYLVILLGITGVMITLVNSILMILGITEDNFGYWLVLQHIGLAGIITIIVMALSKENKTLYRLVVGICILIIYTIFHETTLPTLANNKLILNNMNIIDNTADGGFIGAIGYSALLLIFTSISDVYYTNKQMFRKICLLLIIPVIIIVLYTINNFTAWDGSNKILTAGLSKHLSINKGSVSPSYLIITLFISSTWFMLVDLFSNIKLKYDFFDVWGRNPILMYILEFSLVGGIMAALPDTLTEQAPLYIAIIEVFIITLILTLIANKLYKKNKFIKI